MNARDRVPLFVVVILVALAAVAALMAPFVLAAAGAPGVDAWPQLHPSSPGDPTFAYAGGRNAGW